jgi:hypothetical protein
VSRWAKEAFRGDREAAARFYVEAGRRAFPARAAREKLARVPAVAAPAAVLDALA